MSVAGKQIPPTSTNITYNSASFRLYLPFQKSVTFSDGVYVKSTSSET
jgi:hypothetical protein